MGEYTTQNCLEQALETAKRESEEVGRGNGGRELSLVITKIEEAIHWLQASKNARTQS